jgi:hypothetical protein
MLFRNMTYLPFNAFLLIKREDIRKYPAFLRAVRRKLQNSRQSR